MARRNSDENDSNELLLDTLCNTFGGIILITLLLSLLTEQTRSRIVENIPDRLLVSRLALAETKQESATDLNDQLSRELETAVSDEFSALLDSHAERLERLQELRDQDAGLAQLLAQLRSQSDESAENRADRLSGRLEAIRENIENAENAGERMARESSLLRERSEKLAIESANEDRKRTKSLRLPKEREIGGAKSAPYIIRYGKVFPVLLKDGTNRKRLNENSLRWEELTETESKAYPITGNGWDVTTTQGRQRLVSNVAGVLGPGDFAAIYVYPDSFPQFIAAKEIILNAGRNFGLEVQLESDPLIWTTRGGYVPPPQ